MYPDGYPIIHRMLPSFRWNSATHAREAGRGESPRGGRRMYLAGLLLPPYMRAWQNGLAVGVHTSRTRLHVDVGTGFSGIKWYNAPCVRFLFPVRDGWRRAGRGRMSGHRIPTSSLSTTEIQPFHLPSRTHIGLLIPTRSRPCNASPWRAGDSGLSRRRPLFHCLTSHLLTAKAYRSTGGGADTWPTSPCLARSRAGNSPNPHGIYPDGT